MTAIYFIAKDFCIATYCNISDHSCSKGLKREQTLSIQQLNNIQIYSELIISKEITSFNYFACNKSFAFNH